MSEELFYEVEKDGIGEYEEKKSKFIAVVTRADTPEEAERFIAAKKKEHHDARHNVSAYIVTGEDGRLVTRFSDDGEPAKTAGQPVFEVIERARLVNAVCVVTRYFGGILLGTGGLVRAYSQSAKAAVASAALRQRRRGYPLTVVTDYNGLGKIEYILREKGVAIQQTLYEENVRLLCDVPSDEKDDLEKQITERSAGQARLAWGEEGYI